MFVNAQDKKDIFGLLDDLYGNLSFQDFIAHPCEDTWYGLDVEDDYNVSTPSGATKGVIVCDDFNYVVKLPFIADGGFDYCKAEWRNYLLAEQEGIEKCFAATAFIGEFHGMPVYVQEYCSCDDSETSSRMYNSAYKEWLEENDYEDNNEHQDMFSDEYYDNEDERFIPLCFDMWGVELTNKFLDFMYDNYINDMHSGNWSVGAELKAVDYSGYGNIKVQARQCEDWFRICELAIVFENVAA